MWCIWKAEGKQQTVDALFISVTASFYKVLFVLHLWNTRQDIKIYGQVKHRKGKLSLWEGRVTRWSYCNVTVVYLIQKLVVISMESLVEDVWLDLQWCLDQVQRIFTHSAKLFGLDWVFGWVRFPFFILGSCFKCLHLKEALSRESLWKYFESPQIQNLMVFFNPANPINLSS